LPQPPRPSRHSRPLLNRALNIVLVALLVFSSGWYLGRRGFVLNFSADTSPIKIIKGLPEGKEQEPADFSLFWQVWDRVTSSHLQRPLNGQDLVYGAISGMVSGIGDPYTMFLTPEEKELLDSGLNGRYEGIGVELANRDDRLVIIAPLDGSPAKKAGVLAGDVILEIEGVSTVGTSISEAVSTIRGKAGTTVTLVLQHNSDQPRSVSIVRSKITAPSISWRSLEEGIVYVRVSRFGLDTTREWEELPGQFSKVGVIPEVMVLDLRGNPGGYLQGAVDLASSFFRKGVVVTEDRGDGKLKHYNASGSGKPDFYTSQVVVLIDRGSASSSEILAAALQYHVDAILVGEKTFGKGTIQEAITLDKGAGLHITVAKWLTPDGQWVDGKGLTPDYEIARSSEDLSEDRDPQLDKALELAREKLAN